jgi:succinate dehydrogenase flavin-adding protein (antitoxin of CptAB toxin-antitoxin module)
MVSIEKSRILWRCRRGTKEMDLLLQQFVAERYDTLTPAEQTAFRCLLDQTDPDIMDWVMGKTEPPTADIKHLIEIIQTISLRHPA